MFTATLAGKADKPLQDIVDLKRDPLAQQKVREAASERANNWWKRQGPNWSRQNALIEALARQDPVRAERAMNWVRNGTTRSAGFNPDFACSKKPLCQPMGSSRVGPFMAIIAMRKERPNAQCECCRTEKPAE